MPLSFEFFETHVITIYELNQTQDTLMTTIKELGPVVAVVECRAVSISDHERRAYEQMGIKATRKFFISHEWYPDGGINLNHCIHFDMVTGDDPSEYYFVRGVKNEALLNMVWTVLAYNIPQSQLGFP